jgi:hypothetical protein
VSHRTLSRYSKGATLHFFVEVIMSDGGIGDGVSYCATIRVSGDLTKDQLKALIVAPYAKGPAIAQVQAAFEGADCPPELALAQKQVADG